MKTLLSPFTIKNLSMPNLIKETRECKSKESCCEIIMGKPCSKELFRKLTIPLEETQPKFAGEYDENDGQMPKPLILIENASKVIQGIKNTDYFLEKVINTIIEENKSDFYFLGSYSLPAVMKNETIKFAREFIDKEREKSTDENIISKLNYEVDMIHGDNMKKTIKYEAEILKIRNNLKKSGSDKNILHIAWDSKKGGHYAIVIHDGDSLILYDSMMGDLCKGFSAYSYFFRQVAFDVFEKYPQIIEHEKCPQPTGGFIADSTNLYEVQSIDSQDHFCYMWAILYFHIYLLYGKEGLVEYMDIKLNKPSIAVIKRYIWAVLHYFCPATEELVNLIQDASQYANEDAGKIPPVTKSTAIFLTRFFLLHFRYIWYDLDTQDIDMFKLYCIIDCDLKKLRNNKDINMCLEYAFEKPTLRIVES